MFIKVAVLLIINNTSLWAKAVNFSLESTSGIYPITIYHTWCTALYYWRQAVTMVPFQMLTTEVINYE